MRMVANVHEVAGVAKKYEESIEMLAFLNVRSIMKSMHCVNISFKVWVFRQAKMEPKFSITYKQQQK